MGINYVLQQPYDMAETYKETSPATPMFFVLFPGVDPTPWVESLARTLDITTENGEGVCEFPNRTSVPPTLVAHGFVTTVYHLRSLVKLVILPNCRMWTGKFINISMGQGQEKPAEGVVERWA